MVDGRNKCGLELKEKGFEDAPLFVCGNDSPFFLRLFAPTFCRSLGRLQTVESTIFILLISIARHLCAC